MDGGAQTHRAFKIEFQIIERVVDISLHSDDISQRVNFFPDEVADVVMKLLEDGGYESRMVRLLIQT